MDRTWSNREENRYVNAFEMFKFKFFQWNVNSFWKIKWISVNFQMEMDMERADGNRLKCYANIIQTYGYTWCTLACQCWMRFFFFSFPFLSFCSLIFFVYDEYSSLFFRVEIIKCNTDVGTIDEWIVS